MIRSILVVLMLIVVAAIVLVATGLVDFNLIRGARPPEVQATANGIQARGGQTPQFDVETGSVAVGTGQANVVVPKVRIEKGTAQVPVPKVEVREANQVNRAAQ